MDNNYVEYVNNLPKCKNTGILINQNSKNFLSTFARTFRARRKSLGARYAHAYECARNFLRNVY